MATVLQESCFCIENLTKRSVHWEVTSRLSHLSSLINKNQRQNLKTTISILTGQHSETLHFCSDCLMGRKKKHKTNETIQNFFCFTFSYFRPLQLFFFLLTIGSGALKLTATATLQPGNLMGRSEDPITTAREAA